jgi:hypothetical protein
MVDAFRRRHPPFPSASAAVEFVRDWLTNQGQHVCGALLTTVCKASDTSEPCFVSGRLLMSDNEAPSRPSRRYPSIQLDERWIPRHDLPSLLGTLVSDAREGWFGAKFQAPSAELVYTAVSPHSWSGWADTVLNWRAEGERVIPDDLPAIGVGMPPYRRWVDAAREWIFGPSRLFGNDLPCAGELVVVMPDTRARATGIAVVDAEVYAHTEIRDDSQEWELHFVFSRGQKYASAGLRTVNPQGPTVLPLPEGASQLDVFVVGSEVGMVSHSYFYGRQLEAVTDAAAESDRELLEDLRGGENEFVEFKPFVSRGHEKMEEIIKAVVAFANTDGGRLFLGVTDEGKPQGRSALVRLNKGSSPSDALQDFVATVKKYIREKVKPVPELEVSDVLIQGEPVVVVDVPRGVDSVYATHDNDVWIRRGATNRRPDPETELPSLLVERQQARGASAGDDMW